MFKKQEQVLTRYKTRFSEVVTVYCVLVLFHWGLCVYAGSDLFPYMYMYACTTTCVVYMYVGSFTILTIFIHFMYRSVFMLHVCSQTYFDSATTFIFPCHVQYM